ncbi:MAG: hypothetical protein HXM75_01395 [Mogibacterium diversum]|nr:hypothetical protein [Mogibacterium diversum]MBF1359135.1 hypothetical protein [Mogibacterium diversum]
MKAYKGFNEKLQCSPNEKPFQYEIGKEYEHEGKVKPCRSGFHACKSPLDVLWYYPPNTSRYCEVEVDDDSKGDNSNSKVASRRIKIGAEIGVVGLAKAHIEYVKEHVTHHVKENDRGAATAGEYGAATAGYKGAATAGNRGAATAGEYGAATAGEYGAATSKGKSSTGDYGLSVARGNGVKVKGGLNAVLVIAEEGVWDYEIKDWKAVVVDGEKIKADTWYKLENGELVEVKE